MPPTQITAHSTCTASTHPRTSHSGQLLQFIEQRAQLRGGGGARRGLGDAEAGGEGMREAGAIAKGRAQQRQPRRGEVGRDRVAQLRGRRACG